MIRKQLEKERDRINEEIKNYPRPIPGCDAQFNYLLEERTKIGEELKHIEVIYKESVSGGEQDEGINEFIERSSFINREAVERIRTMMLGEPNSSA